MAKQAIGIIETKGFVALIEASDAALKAADIKMTGTKKNHFAKSLSAKNFKPTCVLGLK